MLTACVAGPVNHSHGVFEKPFNVDGGKTVMLPMTSVGALPAENAEYKWEVVGLRLSVPAGRGERAKMRWVFSIYVKHADAIESVTVEQITEDGGLIPLVRDVGVTLNQGYWCGRAAEQVMASEAMPWLLEPGDSHFLFRVTLHVVGKADTVMYQPTLIGQRVKSLYLELMPSS